MRSLPSHQQRKVAKRAKFLDKIRVASTNAAKKSPSAKKRAKKGLSTASLDFATLSATLGDVGVSTGTLNGGISRKRPKVMTQNKRTALVHAETSRLKQVLQHPEFKANPAAAVTNHVIAALKASAAAKKASGMEPVKRGKNPVKPQNITQTVGAQREARQDSDAVASALASRAKSAQARGTTLRGGEDKRGPKDQLGVVNTGYSKAKKGAGGKKGSKRSKKRARETW